jgi:hypothetical protein
MRGNQRKLLQKNCLSSLGGQFPGLLAQAMQTASATPR